MSKTPLGIKQKKLEAIIAIAFSCIILILSNTKVGYVYITDYRSLDLALIPAMFAAMIGGYRVGIPVAILWGLIGFQNEDSGLQVYTLLGLLAHKVIFVVAATAFYKMFKKIYIQSPYNVYRTIAAAITVKNVAANFILVLATENLFKLELWLRYGVQEYILELALCMLFMSLLIKHLRQVHILNGVKRKEKMRSGIQKNAH